VKQLIYLLFKGWSYDAFFIWFADYHSLLPVWFAKITRKKSLVVIGGYDINSLPEIHYGSLNNPLRSWFTKNTFRFSTICLPVADVLKNKLLHMFPGKTAFTLPTGQDSTKFSCSDNNREKLCISIAFTSEQQTILVKGLDRVKELAGLMPDYQFLIIGVEEHAKKYFEPLPDNVGLIPPVSHNMLQEYLQKSSFYLQLSRSEGLPNALCEAMLCGCIPIGTQVGAIKEAIGQNGFTIEDWDPKPVIGYIRNVFNQKIDRLAIRNWIITNFSIAKRKARLKDLI
jgi:glycosyltransferase involved in cell wall biosynthesis